MDATLSLYTTWWKSWFSHFNIPKSLIVFLISGLWHGASWNFVVWGAWYGFFLSLERIVESNFNNRKIVIPDYMKQFFTILVVMIGWVFFRSPTLAYAGGYLQSMAGLRHVSTVAQPWGILFDRHGLVMMAIGLVLAFAPFPQKERTFPAVFGGVQWGMRQR